MPALAEHAFLVCCFHYSCESSRPSSIHTMPTQHHTHHAHVNLRCCAPSPLQPALQAPACMHQDGKSLLSKPHQTQHTHNTHIPALLLQTSSIAYPVLLPEGTPMHPQCNDPSAGPQHAPMKCPATWHQPPTCLIACSVAPQAIY
jgi:hypothetical protein